MDILCDRVVNQYDKGITQWGGWDTVEISDAVLGESIRV